jgi:PRTRC genetic system protein E
VFTELIPLLKHRAVIMTISDVGEGLLRINVIPRKIEGVSDENTALTSPMCITGSPDELDRELPRQLASFSASILKTATNLDEVKTQHAAAVKALEAENRKKLDEKRKANGAKVAVPANSNRAPDLKEDKPVFGSKRSPAAENVQLASKHGYPSGLKDRERLAVSKRLGHSPPIGL